MIVFRAHPLSMTHLNKYSYIIQSCSTAVSEDSLGRTLCQPTHNDMPISCVFCCWCVFLLEGGNEGLFPGHKPGQALYVGAASPANMGHLPSVVLMLG